MIKEYAGTILDEISLALKDMDYDILWKMVAEIHGANRIFFHSVGRPAINMKNFAMYLKHFGYRHHIIGDATCPAIKPGDALVMVSACGEEANLITAAETVEKIGDIKKIIVTANAESTLAKKGDVVVKLNTPIPGSAEDTSIQPIGSQFEQAVLYVMDVGMSHYFMARLGITLGGGQNPLHANLQ